jgi:hypothetical protein
MLHAAVRSVISIPNNIPARTYDHGRRSQPDRTDVAIYSANHAAFSVGSQQPLGVMRAHFTQVGPMDHTLIHDIKDMDTDMDLDIPTYLT